MAASFVKMALVAMVCMALVGAPTVVQGGMSCEEAKGSLAPCLSFLQNGGTPSAGCCNNLKLIVSSAKTIAERKDICNCFKDATNKAGSLFNPPNAEALPKKCGVSPPFKISTSVDCNSIHF